MATAPLQDGLFPRSSESSTPIENVIWTALKYAGSLKITCAMFFLGVVILFVGTLAQDEDTIVDVKKEYFNSWVAYVPLDVFKPQTIWPHDQEQRIAGGFVIPGGALIGLILLINLVAAKMTRFQMTARGSRLAAGMVLTLIGFVLIALIVFGAHLEDGLQGEPPFSYDAIWLGCVASIVLSAIGLGTWAIAFPPKQSIVLITLWVLFLAFLGIATFLFLTGDKYRIPDPGLRIVWQLSKSLIVSSVMLAGLILMFGARGGNVLIHLGVGLLMLGQFVFGDRQAEERISLYEGERTSVAVQTDIVELAVIDSSQTEKNRIVAFDDPLILNSIANKKPLSDESLPFEIRIENWMPNSDIGSRQENPSVVKNFEGVQGLPPEVVLLEVQKSGGAKSEMNFASAIVSIREKKTSKDLGKYALTQFFNDPSVRPKTLLPRLESDGKEFELALRFRRNIKPFSIELQDVKLEQYTGTSIPKDYSSIVRILDDSGATLQEGRIWMNSPMRFRGETYYQSQYTSAAQSPLRVEQTVLQVVTNAGWLIPYVSCVLVGLGMLAHFGITLTRFASRYDRQAFAMPERRPFVLSSLIIPLILVLGVSYYAYPKRPDAREKVDWYAVGQLPVQHEGRIKPLSSVGSQILKALSNKPYALEPYSTDNSDGKSYKPPKRRTSAEWLMSVMVHEPWVLEAPLVRIDSQVLLDELGIKRDKTNCYPANQIMAALEGKQEKTEKILARKEQDWSFDEKQFMKLQSKMQILLGIWNAYEPIDELLKSAAEQPDRLAMVIDRLKPLIESLRVKGPPAIIPPRDIPEEIDPKLPPPRWDAYAPAFYEVISNFDSKKLDNPTSRFREMAGLLREGSSKSREINAAVKDYSKLMEDKYAAVSKVPKARFEAWYEYFNPIGWSYGLYIIAGLLGLVGLAIRNEWVRQSAFWICVITLGLHTVAIISRIYISERPPVVSLYSAAVFIGWAIVLAGVVSESLFPISISLIVASIAGYLSLQVAYGLDMGDSMPVLQAVLDTQFWLSTHVISVSLGYSATFLAGFLGIVVVLLSLISAYSGNRSKGSELPGMIDMLYRICYGVVCFGMFFSFVGTVLGGLWGDDSWGRFWGWDPKENGALMIVLWNALLLHAKWDRLVGSLGFATLAIAGNIITAWSMFGTNILGVGLHAYGGETGESLKILGAFAASQLVLIGFGIWAYFIRKSQSSLNA
ncbi:MAG: cytochrome c biogenesis protein CcsA [Planctomycetota bacterium]|jgi:ABC-type transport system involved in cytochrome c biogenesis permease subunit